MAADALLENRPAETIVPQLIAGRKAPGFRLRVVRERRFFAEDFERLPGIRIKQAERCGKAFHDQLVTARDHGTAHSRLAETGKNLRMTAADPSNRNIVLCSELQNKKAGFPSA
jgi:hypothetical protein